MSKKKFRLFDAVLASVCVVLSIEAAAPAASIGNSMYFWWTFFLIAFFIPYGMISAELGTTYEDKGGIFSWVKRAFGNRWGTRVAWYYWVNFPLWMASLAILASGVIEQIFNLKLRTSVHISIQLVFIWLVCVLSLYSISKNKLIINIGTIFKAVLMIGLGSLGIYHAMNNGIANPVHSFSDFMPSVSGIPFLAVILFNFAGFEVITTFASEMDNPKVQIPKALLIGGTAITFFYMFASFGIGVAIPVEQLSASTGLIDSYNLFFQSENSSLIIIVGLMFIYTLVVNVLSWAIGVNNVAKCASDDKAMPNIFSLQTANGALIGSSAMNGIVSSILVILAPFIPNQDIFWSFFALNIIAQLTSYMIMFPAFKKLRDIDSSRHRPYKVSGGNLFVNLVTYVPFTLLILASLFSIVYHNGERWTFDMALVVGVIITVAVGEIITAVCYRKS